MRKLVDSELFPLNRSKPNRPFPNVQIKRSVFVLYNFSRSLQLGLVCRCCCRRKLGGRSPTRRRRSPETRIRLGAAAGLVHRRSVKARDFIVLGACRCRRAFFRCLLRIFSLQAFKCCSSLQTSSAFQGWY
ncbi:hypothetical protein RIF29_24605 [Crotalaria pallida]|uniref:Uncharacterized protein n=1 Tax=Crotalaria pallida TaxID=3830 RepID=A0AAN9EKU9_CROPI